MPRKNVFPVPVEDPLLPVRELARWLVGATLHIMLGLVLGLVAAWLMRRRNLHWSWAGVALAPIVAARRSFSGLSSPAVVAAVAALIWSRRWHREDVEAGADLALVAARRRGPLDLLCGIAHGFWLRRRESPAGERWFSGAGLILGRDEKGRAVSIPFDDASGGSHTLIVGATGSGKTVTQTWIAVRAIERGMGAIVIDPKGDRAMRSQILAAARAAERAFIEWTPDGSCAYNPFARGSETEIADKALAGERFTEPHYMRQAQRYLGHVVRALRKSGTEVSLSGIVEHLDPARLEVLVRELPESQAQPTHAYLDSLTLRQQSDLAGVRDRLAILAESDVGPWLDPGTENAEQFDLLHAAQTQDVVYFNLDSDSRPLLTQMLGAAIVQDLQTTVAALQGRPVRTLVVIDEFSAVAAEQVVRLFGRARSAGFSLILSTQELADLRPPGRERLLEQVMGNLSVLLAHRQVVPDSARLISSLAGTKGAWKSSRHSDGRFTRTRTAAGVLPAEEIARLPQGWAAVIVLADGGSARIARVLSARTGG
jgi:type IV secretory pathway TraG/TraD family ATPase VirD4